MDLVFQLNALGISSLSTDIEDDSGSQAINDKSPSDAVMTDADCFDVDYIYTWMPINNSL